MTERLQRLVMHAFRGVPGEMTVDFGKGESIVVYGDNGTGKSTIADALEWYFTGRSSCCPMKDVSTPCVTGGESNGVTSVEVETNGALGGKVIFPDERNAETFEQSGARPSCFADLPLQISSTRPKRRSGRRWSKSWVSTLSKAFEKTFNGHETSFARRPRLRKKRSERIVEPWLRDQRKSLTTRFSPTSSRFAECSALTRRSLSIRSSIRPGSPLRLAPVRPFRRLPIASLLAEIKTLSPPAFEQSAIVAWNDLISSDRGGFCRVLRWSARRSAFSTPGRSTRPLPALRPDDGSQEPGSENRERARGSDGGISRSRALPRSGRSAGR